MDRRLYVGEGIEKLNDAREWFAFSEEVPLGEYFGGRLIGV